MIAFLLMLAAAVPAPTASEYSYRVWRIEDGLPQNRIRTLAQTPDGYLWIGTSEGLARFDGVHFTVFDRSNTPALRDDSILALRAGRAGTLWIGTEGGGLIRYQSGVFRNFGAAEGMTNGFVRGLLEDRGGTLWVGTDRGFFRMRGEGFERLDNTPEVPLATISNIAQDQAGAIWASTPGGLLTMAGGRLVHAAVECGGNAIRYLRQANDGSIQVWNTVSTGHLRNGCVDLDREPPSTSIRTVAEDGNGNSWVGTAGRGLLRIGQGGTTTFTLSSGLPDNTVNAIFEDRDSNLWIGCDDGLLRLSRSSVANIGSREGMEDDNVLTIYPDREGREWLTTLSGQVYTVSGSKVTRHTLPAPASDQQVRTVFEDSHGAFWFGTLTAGVVRQDSRGVKILGHNEGLRNSSVRQIMEDRDGNIWLALGSGFSRWDGKTFRNYYLPEGLTYPSTRCMIFDARGDILIGTDAGLNRVHEGNIVHSEEFAALKNERIWALYQDANGTVWMGTRGGGLLRFRDGRLVRFTRNNGLPANTIFYIAEDRSGKLWFSTSSGIFSADRKELDAAPDDTAQLIHITPFGTADGMATSQMNGGIQPAGAITQSGEVWFPSVRGAVRMNPTSLPRRGMSPVLIEKVVADNKTLPVSGPLRIAPGIGRLQIDFTLCDLVTPQRVSFRYKLEGFEDNWIPALRTRSASYTNLPPGNYTFRVVATDPASAATLSEARLPFTLPPAFYQTRWFYALLAMTLAGLVWGGFIFYARQTRVRYGLLLTERTRLAREMHDTVIQGCVGVATLLEASAGYRTVNPEEADKLLDQARSEVTNTLEEAREAVWDLRHTRPSESSVAMLFDLARKLGVEHHVQITTETVGEGTLDPETDRAILLVGREALRNAVAHAHASRIDIRLVFRNDEVTLEVNDNGAGFAVQEVFSPGRHFGLLGMRERMEHAGGSFTVVSSPGAGTRVKAVMPKFPQSPAAAR